MSDPLPVRILRAIFYSVFFALGYAFHRDNPTQDWSSVTVGTLLLLLIVAVELCFSVWMVLWRRACTVRGIVRGLSVGTLPWNGSRVRLALALFLIGRCANEHGQEVEFNG